MARLVDRVAFALLLLLIAWLPIPYGSNRPWAWALMQLAAFAILSLWLLARALDARRPSPAVAALAAAGAFLLAALLYTAAQALPLPPPLLESLSPRTHALYAPVLAETTVAMTWTSFLKPFGNSGRIGRSIRRDVSVSFSVGRPSRLKKPPGILPAA